jgi:uncharacterized protein YcaQ
MGVRSAKVQTVDLRRYAIARSLQRPTTLRTALRTSEFVQADPIRAPARAQDLILRHRVRGYRVGNLEEKYDELNLDEEYFVNYGFMRSEHVHWLHPRALLSPEPGPKGLSASLLAFVRERGEVHPREAAAHFKSGRVKRWSGLSATTTHLLDRLHFGGDLRVVGRENGIRVYAVRPQPMSETAELPRNQRADALIDFVMRIYAPVPAASLLYLCRLLISAAPQLATELKAAVANARQRFRHARSAGTEWFWPIDEDLREASESLDDEVRLLAPFDPIVWDRRRFELYWGWQYRFEAYTPASQRRFGYYALPVLWRDQVIGWSNVSLRGGALRSDFGYAKGCEPRNRVYARQLEAELDRFRSFLGITRSRSHVTSAERRAGRQRRIRTAAQDGAFERPQD